MPKQNFRALVFQISGGYPQPLSNSTPAHPSMVVVLVDLQVIKVSIKLFLDEEKIWRTIKMKISIYSRSIN